MLRLGKLEAKVENIYNGTGANMSTSTSTATPSATNAEKVNIAGMYKVWIWTLLWFEEKYCPVKHQRALSLEMHPQFSSEVWLICCSVIYCMKLHWKRDWDPGFVLNSPEWHTFPLKFARAPQILNMARPHPRTWFKSDLFKLRDPSIGLYWFSCQHSDEELFELRERVDFFLSFFLRLQAAWNRI